MTNDHPLRERVRDVLATLGAENLEALRPLYAPEMTFVDPIQTLHGIDAFLEMNRRLFTRAKEVVFDVTAVEGTDASFFLAWSARFVAKLGPTVHVDGVSQLRAESGRITWHRDYWDVGSLLASAVPGGPSALRFLRSPLA